MAWSIHPAMYGHSSVFSTLLPGPSHLFFNSEDHNVLWAETHGFSPVALLLCSLLTTKLKWDWTLNVYYPHSSTPSRLFACLHVWEHAQKGVHLVSCKHFTDHVVLSYRPLVIQKQQIMKYQWGRQKQESRRGVKKAIQILLSFSCQLYKTRLLQLEGPTDFVVLQPCW